MLLPRRTAAQVLVAILLLSTFSPASAFADKSFSLDTARNNLTYVVSQLASFFSDLAGAIASHIPVTSLAASAAAPTPSPIAPPAPALDFLATTTPEASTPPTISAASDAPQTTIIQQPVIERIVERTVPAPAASGISEQTLANRLASLKDDLLLRIAAVASAPIAFSGPAPTTPVSTATFATSQRIDQLTNTAINTPTITGGSISGASVSGYLPLSGGTLTGALTGTELLLSGTLTAGTLNVGGLSSSGALFAPYFSATSTTATSTFAGAVGIGTTTPLNQAEIVGAGGSVGTGWVNTHYSGGASTPIPYSVGRGARGTSDSPSAIKTNDYMFIVGGRGMGSTTFSSINRGAISFKAAEDWTDTAQGSLIDFETTANGGTSRTTKMRLTDTGDLGIGTTTPWGKLSITGSGTGTGLAFAVADSANTPRFVIQDNGNVGIGTTSPSARLDVGGYGTNELGFAPNNAIRLFDNYNGVSDISIKNINTNITAASAFQAFDSGGSYVSLTMPGTGNTAAPLFGLARASTTYLFSNTVGANPARNLAIGTLGANSLTFGTNNAARMTFDATGNVGIGTTTPGTNGWGNGRYLSVYDLSTPGILELSSTNVTNGAPAGRLLFTQQSYGLAYAAAIDALRDGGNSQLALAFTAGGSERLRITKDGNVGIGTTSPFRKFEIAGSSGESSGGPIVALYATNGFTNARRFSIQNGVDATSNYLGFNVENDAGAVASTPLTIRTSGNVGIGTTTPWGKLSITGSGTGTGLAFAVADSANTPRFVIQDNGNVGIGTTSPTNKLEVAGNTFLGGTITGTSTLALTGTTGTTTIASGQGFTIGGSQFVVQQGSGNVGIGTASPVARLSVQAASGRYLRLGTASSFIDYIQQDTNQFGWLSYAGQYLQSLDLANGRMSIGAGGLAPLSTLDVLGNLAVGSYAGTAAAPSNGLIVSGNVGIGNTSPSYSLDVNGFINTDGTAGGYKLAGNTVLYASTTNTSLALGESSTAAWMSASSTPWYSVAVGPGALATTPTSGAAISNTAVGRLALGSNTTGSYNTAAGAVALYNNTTGINNTANGGSALQLNTTGSNNVAVGGYTFFNNTSATNTVAIGYQSGYGSAGTYSNQGSTVVGYISGFNFTTGSDYNTLLGYQSGFGITTGARNVLLGHATIAASYNQVTTGSNNIAIGNDVAVPSATASNQLVIGNLIYGTGLDGTGSTISSGNIGIGTTTPTAQLSTTGTVRFSNFGAGTLTTDASGNLSVSSDERLKNIDGEFTRGLTDIVQLNPIQYHWNALSGLDTSTQYAGFSAQNVQTAIPEAVGSSTNGYLTLQDRPLIAALVNAVKEIAQRFTDLAERVVTKEIVATNGRFDRLCVGSACVTEEQFMAMVAAAGQTAGIPSASAPAGTPQAPIIELNGNASSTIELGDTYNDLGARIIAPESDLNLGIVVLLDGATTTQVSIDTSTPGEHTILYTVTSPTSGLTGSAIRTVIISAAEQPPTPANDNPFNAPESQNDNASSTAAVDVAA